MNEPPGQESGAWRRPPWPIGRARHPGAIRLSALALSLALLLVPDYGVTRASPRPRHSAAAPARPSAIPRPIARMARASVTIGTDASSITVPRSFLGLSTEYWGVPGFVRHLTALTQVGAMLEVPGGGPLILRVGGDSADHTYWDPTGRKLPHKLFGLTPKWFREASILVRRLHLRVILDLNLRADDPHMAAAWARAAIADLPRGSVAGFEIGNEPDYYHAEHTYVLVGGSPPKAIRIPPQPYTSTDYVEQFEAYARALARVRAGVPLVGPAVAAPQRDSGWFSELIAARPPGLGVISAHRYPLSACRRRGSSRYPTIPRLLGSRASAGIARTVRDAVSIAHRARLEFRVTELGSVTCGGRRGVSNTFASALWAPDVLFDLLRAGVNGVNVHVRTDAYNAPFTFRTGRFSARPLLYGLILFARTLGPGARLLEVRVHARRARDLHVWAIRLAGNSLHVLLIDEGREPLKVDLALPAAGPATVQRLLARSVAASSGVTLDGQQLGRDGDWQGTKTVQSVEPGPDGYVVELPRYSAALVSVSPGASGRRGGPAGVER